MDVNAEGRTRTGTEETLRGILSPLRLPIPPLRRQFINFIESLFSLQAYFM